MILIILTACFWQFAFAKSNVTEPIQMNAIAEFKDLKGNAVTLNGIHVPTQSNFFIYEDGEAYMSHVERSQERLRKLQFESGKFKAINGDFKLKKRLYWSLTEIHNIRNKDWDDFDKANGSGNDVLLREIEVGECGRVKFVATDVNHDRPGSRYNQQKVIIPARGEFVFNHNSHVEYLRCYEDGRTVIGLLWCGAKGYCGQGLAGVVVGKSNGAEN